LDVRNVLGVLAHHPPVNGKPCRWFGGHDILSSPAGTPGESLPEPVSGAPTVFKEFLPEEFKEWKIPDFIYRFGRFG
jgi:hypothetical protein